MNIHNGLSETEYLYCGPIMLAIGSLGITGKKTNEYVCRLNVLYLGRCQRTWYKLIKRKLMENSNTHKTISYKVKRWSL